MRELLDGLEHRPWSIVRHLGLVDTCFFIDELRYHRDEEMQGRGLGMLSFNAEELVHVAKHLPPDVKQHIRHWLKNHPHFLIVDVPVMPGQWNKEAQFVKEVDPRVAELVPDASDAVLLAAALRTKSVVLTKDKHHLFTAALNNYVGHKSTRVFKEMKEYENWRNVLQ